MRFGKILFAFVLICIAVPKSPLSAGVNDEMTRHPIYFKTQYAGNMGLMSVGAGKGIFFEKMTLDVNYGYLPKWVNGVSVHTVALRPAVNFEGFSLANLQFDYYAGLSITYSVANHTYILYPRYFPFEYYLPNAVHFNPMFGLNASKALSGDGLFSSLAFFAELGALDIKLRDSFTNRVISAFNVWNLSFGFALTL